jgi:hypothetical protein
VFDPIGALRVFRDHGVRFIVIGGYAAGILGAPIVTNDLDICYDRGAQNLELLARALKELGAKLRVAGGDDEELPFILDSRSLAAGDSFAFETDKGAVDVLGTPSGTGGYRDLTAAASIYSLGEGLEVRVVSLDDLMRMKEAAGRAKDDAHLHQLAALRRMTAAQGADTRT